MNTKSSKAKARRLQNEIAADVRAMLGLPLGSPLVRPALMGECGEDIKVAPELRFPFSIECTNTEYLDIWKKLEQAEKNADGKIPLLVFKRNHSDIYVTLSWNNFLALRKADDYRT